MKNFEPQLAGFLNAAQTIVNNHLVVNGFNWQEQLVLERGARYLRVFRVSHGSRSAHCFVDSTNGDILKAATWKAPAKGARANIFDADFGASCMSPFGTHYLQPGRRNAK